MEHHTAENATHHPGRIPLTAVSLRTLTSMGLAALMIGAFAPASQASVLVTAPHSDAEASPSWPAVSDGTDEDDDDLGNVHDTDSEGQPEIDMEDSELLLVMDASRSMLHQDAGDQRRIEAARDSLHSVVESLEDHQQVGLRVFAGEIEDSNSPEACEDSGLAVEIDTDNREDLRTAIDAYDAVGGATPLAYALEQAAGDLSEEGNRTIVLVSDGMENCVPDPCEAAQAIAEQGIDVAIHTVGFQIDDEEAEEAREQLQCIAEAGGGTYHDASDAETLTHTLERISHRAFQPFTLHGEEIDPGSNQDNAPVLEPGAQYVGAFEYETMYYRVARTMENSTLHVGLATYNDSGDRYENAELELTTMGDNRTCGRQRVDWWGSSAAYLFRTAQVAAKPVYDSEHRDAGCGTDDELLLAIHSGGRFGEAEDILGQTFELVVAEEPDPVNGEDYHTDYDSNGLPWDDDDLSWIEMERDRESDEEIIAGNSLNNAPVLEPGETYDTDILPGEVQVFRVSADWNQQVQAEAFFPEPDSTLEESLRSNYTQAHVNILSPHRGRAAGNRSGSSSDIGSSRERVNPQNATTLHRFSHPIWWPNRYSDSGNHGVHSAALAGDYYVVISADPADENVSFTMPYRLTVDTFDVLEAETPDYPDPSQTAVTEERPAPDEDDDGDETAEPTEEETAPQDEDDGGTSDAPTDEASDQEDDDPVAAEQTGSGGNTGLLIGLGALTLLLLGSGGAFLAWIFKQSRNGQQ